MVGVKIIDALDTADEDIQRLLLDHGTCFEPRGYPGHFGDR